MDAFVEQALASDEWGFVERHYRRHDQSVFDVEVSGSRLIYRGRDVFCGVVHDISAHKFAERQLHEQNKLLEQHPQRTGSLGEIANRPEPARAIRKARRPRPDGRGRRP